MQRESVVFAISGTMFGLLVGWIIGSQQGVAPAPAATSAPVAQGPASQTPPLDAQKAAALERQANAEPANAAVRVDLGNLYFDAERYDLAISWYEGALAIDPKNVDASTDLGVSYYSSNQIDRALAQFERSLAVDPTHTKTWLNQGIVRLFGKGDVEGATQSWDRLIAIAPNSPEAARAKEALATVKGAHPAVPGVAAGRGGSGG